MSPTPKQTIEASFIQNLTCPICGQDALQLKSMERYPDYVACTNCRSQFVAEEGGERVMYGEIPASYPRTRRFALQQWAWPEAVARRAAEERPGTTGGAAPPASAEPAAQRPPEPSQVEAPGEPEPPSYEEPPTEERSTPDEPAASRQPSPFSGPEAATEEPEEPAQPEIPRPEPPAEAQVPEEKPEAGRPERTRFERELPEPPTEYEDAFESTAEPPPWQPPEDPVEREPPEQVEAASSEPAAEDEGWRPPFGDAPQEQEGGDLPEEFEPAPEMPDWLSRPVEGEPEPEASATTEEPEGQEDALADLWDEDVAATQAEQEPAFDGEADERTEFAADFMSDLEAEPADEGDVGGPERPAETDQAPEPPAEGYSEEELAAMYWMGEAQPQSQTEEPAAAQEAEPESAAAEAPAPETPGQPRQAIEPEPGVRHRVVLKTGQPDIPDDMCAHCTQDPTVARLPVRATIHLGAGMGDRRTATFQVPICADCRDRVNAQSDQQKTGRLQAHLISVLIALVFVVGALGFQLVDFQNGVFVDIAILGLLALMGYVIPVAFLLLRASRYPKPPDARYVETTMRIASDTEGLETAYEWRSPEYANHFLGANRESAVGGVTKVKERQYESRELGQAGD